MGMGEEGLRKTGGCGEVGEGRRKSGNATSLKRWNNSHEDALQAYLNFPSFAFRWNTSKQINILLQLPRTMPKLTRAKGIAYDQYPATRFITSAL